MGCIFQKNKSAFIKLKKELFLGKEVHKAAYVYSENYRLCVYHQLNILLRL